MLHCHLCTTAATATPTPETTVAEELFCSSRCRDQYFAAAAHLDR